MKKFTAAHHLPSDEKFSDKRLELSESLQQTGRVTTEKKREYAGKQCSRFFPIGIIVLPLLIYMFYSPCKLVSDCCN